MKLSKWSLQLLLLLALAPLFSSGQCAGPINIVVNPQPTSGGYAPGTVVNYCVTMTGYNQIGANWFEGFDINLGPGWLPGSITPVSPPANCGGAGSGGSWIWLNASTSTVFPIQTFGPGYFFDLNNNGIAGDDFGDAGNCNWSFCFNVTVGNNIGSSLSMTVAPLSDGVAANWGSNACDAVNYSTGTPGNIIVNGCQLTAFVTVTSNVSCFGGNNGAVQITPSNGPGPYSFSLSGGPSQSSGTFTGLSAGNYSVVVTASNGCTATSNFSVSQPASGISASVAAQTNVSCNGASDAQFTISPLSGNAPFSFSLNGGTFSTNSTFQNLAAGSYTVTVQDASGCTVDQIVLVTEPQPVSVSVASQTDILCFGQNTGQLSFTGNGGTAPYSFSFASAPFGPSSSFPNLVAGTYSITIMDANACTASAVVNLSQPSQPLSASVSSQIDVACFGDATGEVTIAASGGTAPYLFSLNGGASVANPVFSNLLAGPYSVTVQDASACTFSLNVNIAEPLSAVSLLNVATTDADCYGAPTGSAAVSVTGGTPPYSFSCNGVSNASGSFTSLFAGVYNAIATDANGCTILVPFTISEPLSPLSLNPLSQTNVLCVGAASGQVTLNASGGTGPYNYALSGGGGGTNPVFSNLTAGPYTFVVTDANGCTAQLPINISQPLLPLSLNVVSISDVLCYGGNSGSVSVYPSNGLAPFQYNIAANVNTSGTFSSLTAGSYVVSVTDANSCSASVNISINQPLQPLQLGLLSLSNPLCDNFSDGSISVTVTGGTPASSGYVYQWSNYPSVAGNTISGIPEGSYTITVSDSNGCNVQQVYALDDPDFQISFPPPPVVCEGEWINLTASSTQGAAPVSFVWDFASGNSQSGDQIQYLTSSSLVITLNATDANGCLAPAFSLPLSVNPLPLVQFSADDNKGCMPFCPVFSGSTDIPGSTFEWTLGNGVTASGQQISYCYSESGFYDVALKVTSPQGCFSILNQNNFVDVAPKPLAEFSVSPITVSMADPVIQVSNQSNKDYLLTWNFGDGSPSLFNDFEPSYTFKAPGDYCVVLIAENDQGCVDSAEVCVLVKPEMTMFMPDAFTPNGDGLNDFFEPIGQAYAQIEMTIYSRWGDKVFYFKGDNNVRWSGQGFPDGVYVYDIRVWDTEFLSKRIQGSVSLIR